MSRERFDTQRRASAGCESVTASRPSSTTRTSCRAPGSRRWCSWPSGPACTFWSASRSDWTSPVASTPTSRSRAWSRGWSPGPTRSMTWRCCGTARWVGCSPMSGRSPRLGRSYAVSPSAMSGSSTRLAAGCWSIWLARRRCCPAPTSWPTSMSMTRCARPAATPSRALAAATPASRP